MALYPTHQLVEPFHVDDQRRGVVALESADENQRINACMSQVGRGAQEGLVQLCKIGCGLIFILCCTQFWVRDGP